MKVLIDDAGKFNKLVKGRYGYILFNQNDFYIGRSIEKYGEFSEAEVSIFRELCKDGDIVVEIGANIGTHTIALSKIGGESGRIYAYEPQKIIFQVLCANIALNSIKNVECHQIAISCEKNLMFPSNIRYNFPGNFGGIELKHNKNGHTITSAKLNSILKTIRLDFLKIDVEGMEKDVLLGAVNLIKKYKPILYIENDRLSLIQSFGYRLFWHFPPLFNPENYYKDQENIYGMLVSVNMMCLHSSSSIKINAGEEILDSNFHPFHNL